MKKLISRQTKYVALLISDEWEKKLFEVDNPREAEEILESELPLLKKYKEEHPEARVIKQIRYIEKSIADEWELPSYMF